MKFISSLMMLMVAVNLLADEGSFQMSGTGLARIDSVKHGSASYLIADVKNSQTIYNSTGSLFSNGNILSLSGVVLIKKNPDNFSLEGYAVGVLNGGGTDTIFMNFERNEGDLSSGGGGQGRLNMTGGTGKFENITGTCIYDVTYLEKGAQLIFTKCKYKI